MALIADVSQIPTDASTDQEGILGMETTSSVFFRRFIFGIQKGPKDSKLVYETKMTRLGVKFSGVSSNSARSKNNLNHQPQQQPEPAPPAVSVNNNNSNCPLLLEHQQQPVQTVRPHNSSRKME